MIKIFTDKRERCSCGEVLGTCDYCDECDTHGIGHVIEICRDICWHHFSKKCPKGIDYDGEVGCCLKFSAMSLENSNARTKQRKKTI